MSKSDTKLIKHVFDNLQKLNEKKKKLSKKQLKIAQAAPPPDEITGADFKALNDKKKKNETLEDVLGSFISLDEKKKRKKRKKRKSRRKKPSSDFRYKARRTSSQAAALDRSVARVNKALKTPGKADDIAAYKARDEEEARQRAVAEGSIKVTSYSLSELINEAVEAEKLAIMLEKVEELEEKKKRKKRKKKKKKSGKSSKGLSAAVKKSLDKKADRRGLTRGSVYAEFRKGLAAYYTSGSRKGMSAHQWAHARVNSANPSKSWAVVKKRKGGKKKKKK